MGVLKAKVGGSWVEIPGIGAPMPSALHYAAGPGGTVATGTSPVIVTLTVPAYPANTKLLVQWSLRVAQTTASVFDVIWRSPASDLTHQQGAGALASGMTLAFARPWLANGSPQAFSIVINNWGAQIVTWDAATNIMAIVVP